jgi:tetratricopeptide (TPR) repeat protein
MTASSPRIAPAAFLLSLGLALAPLPVAAQPAATTTAATPAPAPATAPPAEDKAANLKRAEELFFNGKRLYTEGSYEAAILAFQESYELSKEPQLLYNIGNTYERVGDFANARRYLDQYRAFAPENERDVLSRRISALDQRQREKEQKERDAAAAAAVNNPKTGPTQTTPTDQKPVTPTDQPKKKDRVFGPAAIGLTAGVVVGLGLGVGFGIKASGEKKQALEGCMETVGGTLLCSDASQSALDKRKTSALIADVGFVVAGVAAAALIAVVVAKIVKKNKAAPAARAQLVPYANPRGGGLGFSFRF